MWNNLPSFRLRIALLSAALAGSTLVGFAAVSWFQIYNAQIGRLDAELSNQLMRSTHAADRERWEFYKDSLSYAFGTRTKTSIVLLAIDAYGNVLYQSNEVPADAAQVNRLLLERLKLKPRSPFPPKKPLSSIDPLSRRCVTLKTGKQTWRIGVADLPNVRVAIAVSLEAVDREMTAIRNIFLISIPGALLLVAGGAWLISGGALRPVRQLTDVIQKVTVKGLDRRIPIGTTDLEFVELIEVFNQMLERLERSFSQASRFSADAAHELKTPLTILQGELERTLQQVEPGSEVQERLSNLLDEVSRLSGITRKLLLLSLADAGQMNLYLVEVDLSELLVEMTEDLELLAPHLSVKTNIAKGLRLLGDRDLLVQLLQNLLSNAIKYNLPNGWIEINARQTQKTIRITIANASKDIPQDDRHRLFDRFYRGDPARTRKVEGLGLGLSLAREIARAHGGDLAIEATPSGQTAFTLTLAISS
jgi:heavy metal sensor kinase